jgi:hypothetical protein
MFDYNYLEYADAPLQRRYPNVEWVFGLKEWLEGAERYPFRELAELRDFANVPDWPRRIRDAQKPAWSRKCPRVFISHRQWDVETALRIAWLAADEGFDYWLDVTDLGPWLARTLPATPGDPRLANPIMEEILMAAIIEMALLNCTHVIAVMTANTAGSQWVPYEYGRKKPATMTSNFVSCWWDMTTLRAKDLPGYTHLAPVHLNEYEIRAWLSTERANYRECSNGPNTWKGGKTEVLPTG